MSSGSSSGGVARPPACVAALAAPWLHPPATRPGRRRARAGCLRAGARLRRSGAHLHELEALVHEHGQHQAGDHNELVPAAARGAPGQAAAQRSAGCCPARPPPPFPHTHVGSARRSRQARCVVAGAQRCWRGRAGGWLARSALPPPERVLLPVVCHLDHLVVLHVVDDGEGRAQEHHLHDGVVAAGQQQQQQQQLGTARCGAAQRGGRQPAPPPPPPQPARPQSAAAAERRRLGLAQ
jgi:hypothetical protein